MTPKKILLMAHDVTLAHLGRPLRLAEFLIADGHDVTLAASAESARFLKDFPGRVHTLAPTGKARFIDNLAKGRPVFDFGSLKCFAEEDEALLTALRPDLVIGDFRITLSISARRAGIPYATITNAYWHPALKPRFVVPDLPIVRCFGVRIAQRLFDLARPMAFAYHARPMNALRRHYGLPSLGHDLRRIYTDADVAFFSDIPQIYGLEDDISGCVFLGPLLWSPQLPLPSWWHQLRPDKPLVYLTLGSSGDPKLIPGLAAQLATLDIQLVAATAGLAAAPSDNIPNAFFTDYLPGDLVASRASLVICNGGSPTSNQALAHGVPVLGVPGNLDQFLNMHYLEQTGVGLSLRSRDIHEHRLVDFANRLLHDTHYRLAAERIGAAITRHPTQTRIRAALSLL